MSDPEKIPGQQPTNPDEAARLSRERDRGGSGGDYSPDARGRAREETLRTAENPATIWDATLGEIKNYNRTEIIPAELRYYEMDPLLRDLRARRDELAFSKEDLIKRGYISIASDGSVIFIKSGYELSRRPVEIEKPRRIQRDKQGNVINIESEIIEVSMPILGEDVERESISKAYGESYDLALIHKTQVGKHQHYAQNIENITGLAEEAYLGEHITEKGLELLFKTPGSFDTPQKTITGVEYSKGGEIGDIYFTATFLYELIGTCEKREEFLALRNTPGYFEFLFPESRVDFVSDKERFWVGDASRWTEESRHTIHSFEQEAKSGLRGVLTERGNIFANFDVDNYEWVRNATRVFLGGGKRKFLEREVGDGGAQAYKYKLKFDGGDKDKENGDVYFAEDFIFKEYKYYGMASDNGSEVYRVDPNEKDLDLIAWAERVKGTPKEGTIVMTEMGGDVSDDYVKLETDKFMKIYFQKGRDAGPAKLVFNFESRLTTSLIRAISFDLGYGKRSMRELMTGSYGRGGRVVENPVKFANLPWWTAGRRVLQKIGLTKFMGGRGGENPGVFHILQKMNLKLSDIDESWLLDFDKKVQLSADNSAVVTRGEYRKFLTPEGKLDKGKIHQMQWNTSEKIMTALVGAIESYTQHAALNSERGIKTGVSNISQINLINYAIERFNERTGHKIPLIKAEVGQRPKNARDLVNDKSVKSR